MIRSFIFHYGIPFVNQCIEYVYNTYNIINYTINSIQNGFNSDVLIFYDKNPSAYISSYIDEHNTYNGTILWKYNRFHKKFFQYSCIHKDVKHFPIISATINLDDKVISDITYFFNDLSIESSNVGYPSIQHVIEAYTYNSGIVFDRTKDYRLIILDTHLNEHSKNIFTDDFTFTE